VYPRTLDISDPVTHCWSTNYSTLSGVHNNVPERLGDIQESNIVIPFANFRIASETYMKLSDRLICAFQ
jgi:hypothetical protein